MNKALLAKLGWKMLTNPEALWVKVLKNKYGELLESGPKSNVSSLWRHIRSTIPLLRARLTSSNTLDDDVGTTAQWKSNASGIFTVSSAYHIANDSDPPNSSKWDSIWALKEPTRLNFMLWQVCHNALPVGLVLQAHHMDVDGACRVCGVTGEDVLHVLRDYA